MMKVRVKLCTPLEKKADMLDEMSQDCHIFMHSPDLAPSCEAKMYAKGRIIADIVKACGSTKELTECLLAAYLVKVGEDQYRLCWDRHLKCPVPQNVAIGDGKGLQDQPSQQCLFAHNPNIAQDCAAEVYTKERAIAQFMESCGTTKKQAELIWAKYLVEVGEGQYKLCMDSHLVPQNVSKKNAQSDRKGKKNGKKGAKKHKSDNKLNVDKLTRFNMGCRSVMKEFLPQSKL